MKFKLIEDFDYNNHEITPEVADYFKNSKIRINGKLVVLRHGTDADPFLELNSAKFNTYDNGYFGRGFYLTMDSDYASEYGDNVMEFYANVINPFYANNISKEMAEEIADYILNNYNFENNCLPTLTADNGKKYNNIEPYIIKSVDRDDYKQLAQISRNARITGTVLHSSYKEQYRDMLVDLIQNPEHIMNGVLHDFPTFDEVLKKHGYDGVVYEEDGKPFQEVVVYNSNQLKFVSNQAPTSRSKFNEDLMTGTHDRVKQVLIDNFSTQIDYDLPSSIIFRDGTIISGQCHPDLVDCLVSNNLVKKPNDSSGADLFAKDLDCVRLTMDGAVGENYIALPKSPMTGAQYSVVEDWLKEASLHLNWVDVCTDFKPSVYSNDKCRYEINDDSDIRRLLGKIRKFYSAGTLEAY